jgi:N-acetylglucosaminyldiphosphoundecaprenol N-acetyl-beta-D-mannosaminyltransferase
MEEWIRERNTCRYIAVTGMHGVMEAQHDPGFRAVLNGADLVVPDGMPLVWLARARGFALRERVCGPDLMRAFLEATAHKGYRHFFYGGDAGVAKTLGDKLAASYPGAIVAGTYSPPYRPLTAEEGNGVVHLLEQARPDIVWVGLSTPKQERWMAEFRSRLKVPLLIGVGAAFDFLAGRKHRAPVWMQRHGLEWLFRLLQEPRRLWRRYLVYGSEFLLLVLADALRNRSESA